MITVVIISILAITGLVWLLDKILPFKICPICAGVAGTWLWLLAAKFSGYPVELIIPAMLMGGSIVGIAYQIDKKLPAKKSLVLFKSLFVPIGFIAVYSLLSSAYLALSAAIVTLLVIVIIFLNGATAGKTGKDTKELEKQMDNCC